MKSLIKLSFILSVFFSAQTMAAANPVEFWGCKFNDGMGMDDLMAESLNCIGNFYDAADPQAFEHVLQLVLEQAMHNTTVQVDLLDRSGEARESNMAYSFTDSRTGVHHPQ